MVNNLWLVRKLGDFSSELLSDGDVVILIQDGVLRGPARKGWFICREDAEARGLKFPEECLKSYEEIAQLIEEARRVIVW
jgi:sulfur transfer complex TusBCD TusB component (DsrH family)